MITKEELLRMREQRRTNLYYTEKEYLQYIFLHAIAKYGEAFIFKGGTCLRICYGLQRASEDLDFNTILPISKVREILQNCLKDYELLNIHHDVYVEKEYDGNKRFEVRFNGPLYNGSKESTNTLKLDFNKKKVKNIIVKVIPQIFSDVPLFTVVSLAEHEIFAEKLRALVSRGAPRDAYDVWILLQKKVKLDKSLIFEKFEEEQISTPKLKFPDEKVYMRDLKQLVEHVPPYAQVKEEVLAVVLPLLKYNSGTK